MELFGQTPWEVQQGMNQQINQSADAYAKLDPFQRAAAGMHRAGGMLAGPVAGMLGMENPAIAQSKRTEQIMGAQGTDLSSSEGLLKKAEQFRQAGDLRTATALAMKGQEMRRQEAATALAQQKQDFQEKDLLAERIAKRQQDLAIAMQASADRRYGVDAQAAWQKEAMAARRDIAAMKAGGGGMSAAELRQMKYEDTKAEKLRERKTAADTALGHLDAVDRSLDALYDDKTGALTEAAKPLFGKFSQYRPDVLQSQATVDADAALTSLKDQITMSNLADAKKAVGQSFGSMQVQEWDKFVRLLASLDRKQGAETAASNMKFIKRYIKERKDVIGTALSASEPPSSDEGSAAPAPTDLAAAARAELARRKGGK